LMSFYRSIPLLQLKRSLPYGQRLPCARLDSRVSPSQWSHVGEFSAAKHNLRSSNSNARSGTFWLWSFHGCNAWPLQHVCAVRLLCCSSCAAAMALELHAFIWCLTLPLAHEAPDSTFMCAWFLFHVCCCR